MNSVRELEDNSLDDENISYLIFSAADQYFAIHTGEIEEIHSLPHIVPVPDMPEEVSGVINFRNSVITVVDLRIKLGIRSFESEKKDMIDMLKQRENDHRNWLNELQLSVKEKREFKLQTDPHKCKFGLWYDSFKTDDLSFWSLLKKFDEPHKKIHNLAKLIFEAEKSGNPAAAAMVIESGKEILNRMLNIFDLLYRFLEKMDNRLCIVIKYKNKKFAIIIDKALNTIKVTPEMIQITEMRNAEQLKTIKINEGLAVLLDEDKIFSSFTFL
jgi:chemotaxis signal transduction protein